MSERPVHRWRTAFLTAAVSVLIAVPTAVWATHSFNDVPNDNTFHDNIEWLKQSGVTIGCNPPDNTEFCPDDFVTREQMAAFMQRFAQYMGAEDGTPAQADHAASADSADQADSAAIASVSSTVRGGPIDGNPNVPTPQGGTSPSSFTTTRQTQLFVHAQARIGLDCQTSSTRWVWIEIDDEPVVSSMAQATEDADLISLAGFTEGFVPQGDHELTIRHACLSGNAGGTLSSPVSGTFLYVLDDDVQIALDDQTAP